MPPWLSVRAAGQTLSIPRGMRSPEPFVLTFEVDGAPRGAESDAPYTLRDSAGNYWRFSIHITTVQAIPAFDTALIGVYPNPFNPATTIRYSLKESHRVRLVVYNTIGQAVRTLADSPQSAGVHTVVWNGRDDDGLQVSSGVYFCRMEAGRYSRVLKMTLVE